MIETRKIGRYTYVTVGDRVVAIMERSPFTGEYCYGERIDDDGTTPTVKFRPPFQSTYRKTAKAAAKVVVSEIGS